MSIMKQILSVLRLILLPCDTNYQLVIGSIRAQLETIINVFSRLAVKILSKAEWKVWLGD